MATQDQTIADWKKRRILMTAKQWLSVALGLLLLGAWAAGSRAPPAADTEETGPAPAVEEPAAEATEAPAEEADTEEAEAEATEAPAEEAEAESGEKPYIPIISKGFQHQF